MAGIQLLVDNIYKHFNHTLLTSTKYVRNEEKSTTSTDTSSAYGTYYRIIILNINIT